MSWSSTNFSFWKNDKKDISIFYLSKEKKTETRDLQKKKKGQKQRAHNTQKEKNTIKKKNWKRQSYLM